MTYRLEINDMFVKIYKDDRKVAHANCRDASHAVIAKAKWDAQIGTFTCDMDAINCLITTVRETRPRRDPDRIPWPCM